MDDTEITTLPESERRVIELLHLVAIGEMSADEAAILIAEIRSR